MQDQRKPIASLPKHSGIVLGIVMLGTLMGALDSTIVLLAFPTINDSLHSNLATSLMDHSSVSSCDSRCNNANGQNRRYLRQVQNIQFRLRGVHRRLSPLRPVTTHLPAHRLQGGSSGRRSHHASYKRRHNSRLFPQEKDAAEPMGTILWASQLAQCLESF